MGKIINISKPKPGVMVRLPEELYLKYLSAAESVGNTLPSWLRMAAASYFRNWRDSEGKKPKKQDTVLEDAIREADAREAERLKLLEERTPGERAKDAMSEAINREVL